MPGGALLLLIGWAAVEAATGYHEPIARRESPLEPEDATIEVNSKAGVRYKETPGERPSSLLALSEAGTAKDSQGRSCPGGAICGEKADNLVWDQACWDCLVDYQEFYCEKNSLTSPAPTFVDVCAKEGDFRGAFCKKFAEMSPPQYYQECFFPGSEYKQIYCEKLKLQGKYKPQCAADNDVGPNYCESFAVKMQGFIECHAWPGYMMLYCETKQNATIFDATCANHNEVGSNFCEDFAIQGEIMPDCVKYPSYLTLFCDIKASSNSSVETCASSEHTAGMYCQELALKKNGFQACWGVSQFDATYCAEISWPNAACDALTGNNDALAAEDKDPSVTR